MILFSIFLILYSCFKMTDSQTLNFIVLIPSIEVDNKLFFSSEFVNFYLVKPPLSLTNQISINFIIITKAIPTNASQPITINKIIEKATIIIGVVII
jgi:hypothetical protein